MMFVKYILSVWGRKKIKIKSWFLSFANKTDTLENFCLLNVYHLAGRRTAAELNYMLPHKRAQLNSITWITWRGSQTGCLPVFYHFFWSCSQSVCRNKQKINVSHFVQSGCVAASCIVSLICWNGFLQFILTLFSHVMNVVVSRHFWIDVQALFLSHASSLLPYSLNWPWTVRSSQTRLFFYFRKRRHRRTGDCSTVFWKPWLVKCSLQYLKLLRRFVLYKCNY